MATSSIFISSLPTSSVISETAAFPLDQNGNTYQVTGNLMLQGLYTASNVNNIINTIITPNFNSFTSSYKTDSSSFNTQISTLSSSYRTDSSSFNLRIISGSQSLNTYSSSIGVISSSFDNRVITTSQSLSTLSSSYRTDSSSFDNRVITTSQSLSTLSSSYRTDSSSFDNRIITTSQSLSTLSSSYRTDSSSFDNRVITTSQSLSTLSSSYRTDSSSFDQRVITTSQSLSTLSSSYRTDSSSFNLRIISGSQSLNTYSSSIGVISSSFDQRIITTSQSLNTYTPTSSFNTLTSSFNTLSQSIQLYDSEISIYSTGSTPPILGTDYNINGKVLNITNVNKFSIKYPELYSRRWGQTSQTTGQFYSLILSGSVIFAGSDNGIYLSSNGGVTWGQTSKTTGYFNSLILSGSVIFAGNYFNNLGIYSSSNGGVTWSQTSQTTGYFSSFLLSGSVIFAGNNSGLGIYSSSNGGVTWSQTSQTTGNFISLLLSGSIIFAGSDNGIYSSSNGGSTWGLTSQNTGTFTSLLLSGSVIFAGGVGIYSSSNGGVTWGFTSFPLTEVCRTLLLLENKIIVGSGNGIYSSSNGGVTWSQTSQNTGNFYSLLLSGSVIFAGSQNNGIYSSSLSLNSIYENKIYISNNTSSVVGTLPITDNNAYKVDSSSFNLRIISSSLAMRDVVIPFYTANPLYTTPVSGSDYNIVNNNIINTAFPLMSTIPIYGKYDNLYNLLNINNTYGYYKLSTNNFYYNSSSLFNGIYLLNYNTGIGDTWDSGSLLLYNNINNTTTQSVFIYNNNSSSYILSKNVGNSRYIGQITSLLFDNNNIYLSTNGSSSNLMYSSSDGGLNFKNINSPYSIINPILNSTYGNGGINNIIKLSSSLYSLPINWSTLTGSHTNYINLGIYTTNFSTYNIYSISVSSLNQPSNFPGNTAGFQANYNVLNLDSNNSIIYGEYRANAESGKCSSQMLLFNYNNTSSTLNYTFLSNLNNLNFYNNNTSSLGLYPNYTLTYISNFNKLYANVTYFNGNIFYLKDNLYSSDKGITWQKNNIYVNPTTLEVTNNYSGLSNCQINDGFYSSELNSYITGGTYILKTQDGINFSLVSKNPNFRGKIALGKNNVLLNNVQTITNGITTSSIYQSSISSIYKTNVYFSNLKQQPNNSKLELFSNYGNTYQLTGTPPSSFTWDIVLYSTVYISNQLTTPINFYLTNIDSYVNTYNNNIELNLIFNISNAIPTINFYNSSLITINTSNGGGTTEHSTWQYVKYNFIYNNGNIIGFSQRL